MYRYELKTFVITAECGSFTAASEKAFVSPTAVMKQINQLERHLGLILFRRTNHGLVLTRAGESLLEEARFLISRSERAVERIRGEEQARPKLIKVGTSMLNPCRLFMDVWNRVNEVFPEIKIQVVPFEDSVRGIVATIEKIGVDFDFITGVCDSAKWLSICNFYRLGRYRKMVAVPHFHPLAAKASLEISDLYGQTLAMVSRGDSPENDRLRDFLRGKHPQIQIEDVGNFYDISIFNRCAENGLLLLNTECWKDIHPGLVTLPVNWDFSIPFGILYSKTPSDEALAFLSAVKSLGAGALP